jgi:biopolymer transport protein TolR
MAGGIQTRTRRRSRSGHVPMSEINVTPFVDVMLVLLVIFMITAPLLTAGVEIDLPETEAGAIQGEDEPLAITVDAAGQVFLQETPVDLTTLVAKLDAITGRNPDARVFIRADQAIDYGRVMQVMGTVNGAGYRKVALVTRTLDADAVAARDAEARAARDAGRTGNTAE